MSQDQQQDLSEREADANALATYADRVTVLEGEVASLTQTLEMRSAALDRVTATNGTATARVRELEAEVDRLTADIDECWVPLYHGEVHERRQAEARAESAEAERDALQQRLANVQALPDAMVKAVTKIWEAEPGTDYLVALDAADYGREWLKDALAALAAPAVSSRPGMTVTEAVADALNDHRENTGQITGGTPGRVRDLEAEAGRLRGLQVEHIEESLAGSDALVEALERAESAEAERARLSSSGSTTFLRSAPRQDGDHR